MGARTLTKATISLEAAQDAIRAAERKATEMSVPMVIAVVDEAGALKAFSRMDGAPCPPSAPVRLYVVRCFETVGVRI